MDKHSFGGIDLVAFLRLSAYIKRAVCNEANNYRRELMNRSAVIAYENELPEGGMSFITDDYEEETFCAVESELEIMGLRFSVEEPLYSALTGLDPASFKVIAMTHWLGMTAGEISAITGINPRKVLRIRHKVYKILREKLEGLV